MPTITQLPQTQTVSAADAIPISQGGAAHSVSVGTLLSSTQATIVVPQGSLLGRTSLGAGGPEQIAIGSGLVLNATTLQAVAAGVTTASEIVSLPSTATASAADLIAISQAGTEYAIAYASLLNGQTIDQAQPATAVSDGDSFWVAQGSNTMVRQTFSAVWPWIASKLVTFKPPVVEIAVNTTLDGTVHNGRVLVCSQPVTLTPIVANLGSGFQCEVLNLSAGSVVLAGVVVYSNGAAALAAGQAATIRCITYSGGTILYAFLGDGGVASPPEGGTNPPAGAVTSIAWNVPPSGSFAHGTGVICVNAHATPATAALQFGFSLSATVHPTIWTAGVLVNTDLWGAYVPTPATAGTWYAWAAGTDGSAPTPYATPFVVS